MALQPCEQPAHDSLSARAAATPLLASPSEEDRTSPETILHICNFRKSVSRLVLCIPVDISDTIPVELVRKRMLLLPLEWR